MPQQETEYQDYRATVRASFQEWYDAGRDSWTASPTNDRVTAFAIRSAPPGAAGRRRRVLDVGCGKGRQTALLAEELDADCVGVDLLDVWAPEPVRRGTVTFHQGDFLGYDEGAVDLLVDNGCLHHQRREDWEPWVRHGRTLLRDGGRWVVSCFLSPHGDIVDKTLHDGRHNWWLTEEYVGELFAGAGFTLEDREEIDRDFTYEGHALKYLVLAFSRSGPCT